MRTPVGQHSSKKAMRIRTHRTNACDLSHWSWTADNPNVICVQDITSPSFPPKISASFNSLWEAGLFSTRCISRFTSSLSSFQDQLLDVLQIYIEDTSRIFVESWQMFTLCSNQLKSDALITARIRTRAGMLKILLIFPSSFNFFAARR